MRTQGYQPLIQQFYIKLVDWIVKLNSDVLKQGPKPGGDSREYLEKLANIIVSGINLAVQIKRATKTLMMLHDITGATLSAERLKDIL